MSPASDFKGDFMRSCKFYGGKKGNPTLVEYDCGKPIAQYQLKSVSIDVGSIQKREITQNYGLRPEYTVEFIGGYRQCYVALFQIASDIEKSNLTSFKDGDYVKTIWPYPKHNQLGQILRITECPDTRLPAAHIIMDNSECLVEIRYLELVS